MDIIDYIKTQEILDKNIEYAQLYRDAALKAAEMNSKLDLLLSKRIDDYIKTKGKNIGREMGLLMLMNEGGEAIEKLYIKARDCEANRESYKMMIEVNQSIASYKQSLMKYEERGR